MGVGKRGPTSAAELAIVPVTPLGVQQRIEAPHDLTGEETEVWVAVVNAEPADHFSASTTPLLAQYCRHVISSRHVAELIERMIGGDLSLRDYNELLHMQERESRVIATLATKMRISQQSTINHRGNKNKPTQARKLWE
jgi:hypothetical protein